jgi:hypothetical protein
MGWMIPAKLKKRVSQAPFLIILLPDERLCQTEWLGDHSINDAINRCGASNLIA